jgi:protein-disulfide isomerase
LARSSGIFLSLFTWVLLAGTAFSLQGAAAPQKTGSAAQTSNGQSATTPATPTGTASLSPELVHRIQTEIRSRYNVPPSVSVIISDPKPGSTPDYDDLTITLTNGTQSSPHQFLLSKDRKTLAQLEKFDVSQDIMSQIDVKGRPVRGNPEAKVTIVNFDDFQCPFCSHMHSTLFSNVFKDYATKVKIIYKDYPLFEIHPWAIHAAIDGNCLGDQNNQAYWDFADYVHGNQKMIAGKSREEAYTNLDSAAKDQGQRHQLDQDKLQACIKKQDESTVRASIAEGDKLGIDSTPTMFINGERFTGAVPEDELRAVLDRAVADSKQQAATSADTKK